MNDQSISAARAERSAAVADDNRTADRQAIVDVALRYASSIDLRDFGRLLTCFTDDAVWTSSVHHAEGLEQIDRCARGNLANLEMTQHVTTNFEIALDGDRARMRCLFLATHRLTSRPDHELYVMGGYYDDELRNGPAGWKLSRRALTIQWTQGDPLKFV